MRWLVLLGLLCACGQSSPDEQLLKSVEPATTWAASLQMVAEKYAKNSVPSTFVRNSADAADKAIEKAMKAVEKSDATVRLRDTIRRDLTETRNAASSLRHAAETGDRRAAARLIDPLKRIGRELDSLQQQ